MPKSWDKRYQWILQQKTSLDHKFEELRLKVDEVEQNQEKKSTKINDQIFQSKIDLMQQHTEIMKKHQDMLVMKENIQENVNKIKDQHKTCISKINKSNHQIHKADIIIESSENIIKNDMMMKENIENIQQ